MCTVLEVEEHKRHSTMDELLNKVREFHQQAVKDSEKHIEEYKKGKERLQEQNRRLQNENDDLLAEIRELKTSLGERQRPGACCASIRLSLETVTSSYKQLLQEKECRIERLEEDLKAYQQQLAHVVGNTDRSFTTIIPNLQREGFATVTSKDQIPDSTSTGRGTSSSTNSMDCATVHANLKSGWKHDQCKDSGNQNGMQNENHHLAKLEEAVEVHVDDCMLDRRDGDVSGQGQKLRLQRRGGKRSRYSEEVSPEQKRLCKVQDPSHTVSNTESSIRPSRFKCSETGKLENVQSKKFSARGRQKSPKYPVLAPNTCAVTEDPIVIDGIVIKDQHHDGSHMSTETGGNNSLKEVEGIDEDANRSVMVVPETLAVDMDGLEDSGDEMGTSGDDKTPSKLNRTLVERGANRKIWKDHQITNETLHGKISNVYTDMDEANSELRSCRSKFKNNAMDEKKKQIDSDSQMNTAKEFTLRNALFNQISEDNCLDDESDTVKETSKESSIVCVTDDDGEETMTPSSQTFGKPKNKEKNQSKKLKEIDDLFNSPDDLAKSSGLQQNLNKQAAIPIKKRKQIFKQHKSLDDRHTDVVLRRSPRKHKTVNVDDDLCRARSSGKLVIGDHKPEADAGIDPDMTVDPNNMTENQSLDCYNVVPIQNGEPVSGGRFLVKVSHRKDNAVEISEHTTRNLRNVNKDKMYQLECVAASTMNNEKIKSPSLLSKNCKVNRHSAVNTLSQRGGTSMVGSPNGTLSDPESPLLLKRDCSSTSETKESEWTSKALGKKQSKAFSTTNSKPAIRSVSLRSSSSSAKPILKGFKPSKVSVESNYGDELSVSGSKGKKPVKRLHQTTLTQGFFGNKGQDNDDDDDEHSEEGDPQLQEALRRSLEDVEGSQDNQMGVVDVDIDNNTPETQFKIPSYSINRARSKRRTATQEGSRQADDDIGSQGVSSVEPRILHDISSEMCNVDLPRAQLNGSLDPAAELSQLCREPGLSESSPVDYLPSLDMAADFRLEELQSASQFAPKQQNAMVTEESQDIPCSSRSHTFGPRKKLKKEPGDENREPYLQRAPEDVSPLVMDSFDRPPKKQEQKKIAHVAAVVRKKDERQKLQGYSCKQCLEYYRAAGRSEEEIQKHMQQCSRHRANHPPPDTPPHFWSVGFADTQECLERGYLRIEDASKKDDAPSHRRRRRLNKYFRSKNEASNLDHDSQDSQDALCED